MRGSCREAEILGWTAPDYLVIANRERAGPRAHGRSCPADLNRLIFIAGTNKKGGHEAAFFGGEVIRAYRSRRNKDPHSTNPFLPAETVSRMHAKSLKP